MKSNNRLLLTN